MFGVGLVVASVGRRKRSGAAEARKGAKKGPEKWVATLTKRASSPTQWRGYAIERSTQGATSQAVNAPLGPSLGTP